MKLKNDFITWGEWLHMRWANFRFFFYKKFHRICRFQNWEVRDVVKIKPRKKGIIISGCLIHEDGSIEIL